MIFIFTSVNIPENNSFFRKLGLIKSSTVELSFTAQEFVNKFQRTVGSSTNSLGYASHNQEFHGSIKNLTFNIYPSVKFGKGDIVVGRGSFNEDGDKLHVELCVVIPMLTIVLYCIVFMLICISPVIVTAFSKPDSLFNSIVVCGSLFLIGPVIMLFSLRKSVKGFLNDLNIEFKNWELFYHNEAFNRNYR